MDVEDAHEFLAGDYMVMQIAERLGLSGNGLVPRHRQVCLTMQAAGEALSARLAAAHG